MSESAGALLGYDPFPEPGSVSERLLAKRRAMGWSIREAAAELGVDPGDLGRLGARQGDPVSRASHIGGSLSRSTRGGAQSSYASELESGASAQGFADIAGGMEAPHADFSI
jgi:transcriptional regulator with XRE-family HTH domain